MKRFLTGLLSLMLMVSMFSGIGYGTVVAYAADKSEYLLGDENTTPSLKLTYSDVYMGDAAELLLPLEQNYMVESTDAGYWTDGTLEYVVNEPGQNPVPSTLTFQAPAGVTQTTYEGKFNLVQYATDYKVTLKFFNPDTSTTETVNVTFKYPALAKEPTVGGNPGDTTPGNPDGSTPGNPDGSTPGNPDGSTPDPAAPVITITPSTTNPTSKEVVLNATVTGMGSDWIIRNPAGVASTKGASTASFTTKDNGTFEFQVLDDTGAVKARKSYTVSNIDIRTPQVGTPTYSNVTANSMTATVNLGEYPTTLWQIDTSALPAGYSATVNGNSVVVSMPNVATTLQLKATNTETNQTLALPIITTQQPFASGTLKFESYSVLDWDEDDLDIRLNFSGMEGYTFRPKSVGSKYNATISGPNSIDLEADNKTQTLKLEFEDSSGTTKRVSVKIYKAPVITKVEAADLTAKKTNFKFYFEGISSSFYDLDDDQFDSDMRAKWSRGVLTLRLETEDDVIDMTLTDDYGNSYDISYDLEIDELLSTRDVTVNKTTVISKDNEAKEAVVEITFNGVRDLYLDEDEIWDYNPKKMDASTYRLTMPYGSKTVTFTFEDEDWDKTYTVKHQFRLDETTVIGETDYKDVPVNNAGNKPAGGNIPQTGGSVNGLSLLVATVKGK